MTVEQEELFWVTRRLWLPLPGYGREGEWISSHVSSKKWMVDSEEFQATSRLSQQCSNPLAMPAGFWEWSHILPSQTRCLLEK